SYAAKFDSIEVPPKTVGHHVVGRGRRSGKTPDGPRRRTEVSTSGAVCAARQRPGRPASGRFVLSDQSAGRRRGMANQANVAAVEEITARFKEADTIMVTEYRGLSVSAMTELRRALGADVTYSVAKKDRKSVV